MILYIVRHAWAGQYGDPQWPDDFERPLSEKGRERFMAVATALAERGVAPGVIATSPLVRCRQTAELLARAMCVAPPIVEMDALRPGSDAAMLIKWTAKQAKEHEEIAWVGHSPDVDRLTSALIGQAAWIRLAKGSVAAVRFYDRPELGSGELRWLVTAKILGC